MWLWKKYEKIAASRCLGVAHHVHDEGVGNLSHQPLLVVDVIHLPIQNFHRGMTMANKNNDWLVFDLPL